MGTVSSKEVSAWMARLARRKARKMTKAERTALALKMNEARWAKARKAKVQDPSAAELQTIYDKLKARKAKQEGTR